MKKVISSCLFALIAALLLTSCTRNTTQASASPAVSQSPATTVQGNQIQPSYNYFGADVYIKPDIYNIDGNIYLNINDVSKLFKIKITYDNANNTISIGDTTRASAVYYMPDISAYPNLDTVIDLPPYEIYTDGGIVDFSFITKNVPFKDMINKIDQALKTDGFTITTDNQYSDLTKSRGKFKQGKIENTYIKYKNNNNTAVTPYAIQIIDGGVDKNKMPIIIVRMGG